MEEGVDFVLDMLSWRYLQDTQFKMSKTIPERDPEKMDLGIIRIPPVIGILAGHQVI
jgi:hypothetical protein